MKKLKRENLDELVKVMNVFSENEQRACIGGVKYYNENGVCLYTDGSDPEIRIISDSAYNMAINSIYTSPELSLYQNSEQLSMTTSTETKSALLLSIAQENDLSSVGFVHIISNSDSSFYGDCNSKPVPATTTISVSGSVPGGSVSGSVSVPDIVWVSDIRLNTEGSNFENGNYYDLQLTIIHEKAHARSPLDQGSATSEVNAYNAVYNNDNFKYASTEFQEFVKKERLKFAEAATN